MKMRKYITLIMLLLCLSGTIYAQSPLLDKKVSLQYREMEIGKILKDLNKRYKLNFSYSNNIVPEKKKISINIKNVMLKDALNDLFNETDIAFKAVGEQIVLKRGLKKNSSSTQKYRIANTNDVVTPILFDTKAIQENLLVSNNEDFIIDTMPDDLGMEMPLLIEDNYQPTKRDLRRKYKGEKKMLKAKLYVLKDSLRRKGGNTADRLDLKYNYILQKMRQEFNDLQYSESKLKKETSLAAPKDSTQKSDTSITDEKPKYWYRPFQITFVSPLGTNGYDCGRTVNTFSLNMIGGYAAGLEGVELGGVANIERDYVVGVQMAGFCNVVKGTTEGIQLAGFTNICGDSIKALQASGFCNVVNGSVSGMQNAGFCNVDKGAMNGFQGAGFLNVIQDSLEGIQIAGFANINSGDVHGIQAAGFLNTARKVHGIQLGIINISDTMQGIPIGLLSIVRKGGYRRFDIYGSESLYANMAFKMGVRSFYNIFTVGAQLKDDNLRFGAGYGVGSELGIGKRVVTNIEATTSYIWEDHVDIRELNTLNKLSTTLGVRIGKTATIYAGPTLNVMISSQYLDGKTEPGSGLSSYSFYNHTFEGDKDVNLKMWIGFNAGIRF
jgi:hypothetical protein